MATAAATAQDDALAMQLTAFVDAVAKGAGVNRATAVAALTKLASTIARDLRNKLRKDGDAATDKQLSQLRSDLDHVSRRLLGSTGEPTITCNDARGQAQTFTLSQLEAMPQLPAHLLSQLPPAARANVRALTGQRIGGKRLSQGQALATLLRRTRKR